MNSRRLSILGIVGVVGLITLSNTLFVVSQTEQALVLQFGRPIRPVQEPGLNAKIPFIQNVEYFDKRLLDFYADEKEVIAADQKRLIVDAFVRYRITDPLRFKLAAGDERTMRSRLNAILEASLRQAVGSAPLSAVVSEKRAGIMQQIKVMVNAQAAGAALGEDGKIVPGAQQGFGIEVVDVRITRADLPTANSESIYRRMQTERQREAKEFRARGAEDAQKIRATADKERTILLAEARKKAETTRGEGDSAAIKIFAAATNQDPDFYQFYRTMQAYRASINPNDTTMILSPTSEFLRYMDKTGGR